MEIEEEIDDEMVDSDFDDMDLEREDLLEEDEFLVKEDEEIDDDLIYSKLERRNSKLANSVFNQSFTNDIVNKESGGDYTALNPTSSAVGKYQFLWNTWGNEIMKVTGVRSKEEFRYNPKAQDLFYNNYYLPNKLLPAVKDLKSTGTKLSNNQLAKLIHFRGKKGAVDYLEGRVSDKPESNNMSISKYIGMQTGGITNIKPGEKSFDFNKIPEIFKDGISLYNNTKNNISAGLSNLSDGILNYTSEEINNEQYREMIRRLSEDELSNYESISQKVNNNPII